MSILNNIDYIGFDFDGVFTDNTLLQDQEGREYLKFSKYDSLFIKALKNCIAIKKLSIELFVISGEHNSIVKYRCNKLGLICYQGIDNKFQFYKENFVGFNSDKEKSYVYLGNDLNDINLIRNAYFSFCPKDSPEFIKKNVDFITKAKGGQGFIREVIEYLFKDADISEEEIIEFIEKQ